MGRGGVARPQPAVRATPRREKKGGARDPTTAKPPLPLPPGILPVLAGTAPCLGSPVFDAQNRPRLLVMCVVNAHLRYARPPDGFAQMQPRGGPRTKRNETQGRSSLPPPSPTPPSAHLRGSQLDRTRPCRDPFAAPDRSSDGDARRCARSITPNDHWTPDTEQATDRIRPPSSFYFFVFFLPRARSFGPRAPSDLHARRGDPSKRRSLRRTHTTRFASRRTPWPLLRPFSRPPPRLVGAPRARAAGPQLAAGTAARGSGSLP